MRSGVTGRSRTDTSGITTHGSAIELRSRPSTLALSKRRLMDSTIRFERMRACAVWFAARCLQPLGYVEMGLLAPRARLERATSGFVGRRSDPTELTRPGLDDPIRTDVGLRRLVCSQMPSAAWLRRDVWHRTTGSNREPSALEAAALPVELARSCLVGADGLLASLGLRPAPAARPVRCAH